MKQLLTGIILLLAGGTAVATEEPKYEVIKQYEAFELRRYAPQLLAETEVTGEFKDVGNQAFRILADFIFGNNRQQEKISMTAPVSMQPTGEGEKIAMTAPVTMTPKAGDAQSGTYVFSFVMPAHFTRETLPQPVNPKVKIHEAPARLMAVRRYSGFWSESRYREQEAILLKAVAQAGLPTTGQPVFARYNPPFSLWFLRRNEVLIEVTKAP
ncbi:MAG: heme-binding protein [Gammaproteobacteria bacterium]|nr:heme-binding protein [Gammaproteobacteria bacterium]